MQCVSRLAEDSDFATEFVTAGGMAELLRVVSSHPNHAALACYSCCALENISAVPDLVLPMRQLRVPEHLGAAKQRWPEDVVLQTTATNSLDRISPPALVVRRPGRLAKDIWTNMARDGAAPKDLGTET